MRWIPFIVFLIAIQWYAFQALKTLTQIRLWWVLYGFFVTLVVGSFLWQIYNYDRSVGWTPSITYTVGWFIALITGQLVLIPILFFEDLSRIAFGIYRFFSTEQKFYLPERRKFIAQAALALSAVPFASLLYGMYQGRYNYKVLRYTLEYESLPESFDGFQITQFSDLHCSFDNFKKVAYGIDLINEQKSDLLFLQVTWSTINHRSTTLGRKAL